MPTVAVALLGPKWRINMLAARISAASAEPVAAAVAAYANGLPLDPRAYVVAFGLSNSDVVPPAFNLPGTWDKTLIGTFIAQFTPPQTPGESYVWISISDAASGLALVRQIGKLIIEEATL